MYSVVVQFNCQACTGAACCLGLEILDGEDFDAARMLLQRTGAKPEPLYPLQHTALLSLTQLFDAKRCEYACVCVCARACACVYPT